MMLELAQAALPDTIAAWPSKNDGTYVVYTSELYKDGWTTPAIAAQSDNRIISTAIGSASFIDAAKQKELATSLAFQSLIIVWTEVVNGEWLLKLATRDGENWTTAQQLTTLAGENLAPTIVHDLSGNPWVFWSSNATGNDDIYFTRRINGSWSETEMVNPPNKFPDILPNAYVADNGEIIVEWDTLDTTANLFIKSERAFTNGARVNSTNKSKEVTNMDVPQPANTGGRINLHYPKNKFIQSVFTSQNY